MSKSVQSDTRPPPYDAGTRGAARGRGREREGPPHSVTQLQVFLAGAGADGLDWPRQTLSEREEFKRKASFYRVQQESREAEQKAVDDRQVRALFCALPALCIAHRHCKQSTNKSYRLADGTPPRLSAHAPTGWPRTPPPSLPSRAERLARPGLLLERDKYRNRSRVIRVNTGLAAREDARA